MVGMICARGKIGEADMRDRITPMDALSADGCKMHPEKTPSNNRANMTG